MDVILPGLLIFAARLADVSIGTVRIVTLVQGRTALAGTLGFFESAIWLLAASSVVSSLDDPVKMIGWAAGFGVGTSLGAVIERRIGLGKALVRVISPTSSPGVADSLRTLGFGVTVLNAEGLDGPVRMAFTVVPRRRVAEVLDLVKTVNPEAFVTVERTAAPDLALRRHAVRV